jgi:hypothetical protein
MMDYTSVNKVIASRKEGENLRYDIVYTYNNDGGDNFHWSLELFENGEVLRLCASAYMDPSSKEAFYQAEFVSGDILSWFMTETQKSDLIIQLKKTEVDDITREDFVVYWQTFDARKFARLDYDKDNEEFLFFRANEYDGDVVHQETLAEYNITTNQITFHQEVCISQIEKIVKFCKEYG